MNERYQDSAPNNQPRSVIRRWVGPFLLFLGISLAAVVGGGVWDTLSGWIEDAGPLGLLVFYAAFVVLTTFCFPVSVLGFSAGAMFGPLPGLGLLLLSGFSSGLVMFFVGRFLFRAPLQSWVEKKPRLAAVDRLAARKATRLNFLARLSPLNYGVVCYTLASGKSPFHSYVLGMIAIIPGMAGQVFVGHFSVTAGQALGGEGRSTWEWVGLIAGLVFFIVLSWQVGRLVRQAWKESEDEGLLEDHR